MKYSQVLKLLHMFKNRTFYCKKLSLFGKNSADDILKYVSFFSQKTGFGISCKLSPDFFFFFFFFFFFWENRHGPFMQIVSLGDNLHELSKPVFRGKNKKCPAEFARRVVEAK